MSIFVAGILRRPRTIVAQCQSKIFFPEDPTQRPQFADCPRKAETTRRDRGKGYGYAVKLCRVCANEWDAQEHWAEKIAEQLKAAGKAVGA